MSRKTKLLEAKIEVNDFLVKLQSMLLSALDTAPICVDVYRPEDARNSIQNAKFHAMISDINKTGVIKLPHTSIRMSGYDMEKCKALLVMWFANEIHELNDPEIKLPNPPRFFSCPLTGKLLTIRPSTREWSKKLTSVFVEWLYSTGNMAGVTWSEPALKEYESWQKNK